LAIILDVVVIAIIVMFAMIGYKSGFVKTAIELLGWIAVLLFASVVANQVSALIFDNLLVDPIKKSIIDFVTESGKNGIDNFFDGLPEYLTNILNVYNINAQSINITDGAKDISASIIEHLRTPIISLISFLLNLAIFILGIILVKTLAKVCNSVVSKIPIVANLNRLLGFVSGMAKGFVITIVLTWIFSFILLFSGGFFGITYDTLGDTYLLKLFNELNPLTKII